MPSRVLLCFTLSPTAPALAWGDVPTRASPFGRWLHQQVTATSRQWPVVAFQRLRFLGSEVRLVVCCRHPAPCLMVGLVVARTLQRETTEAARAVGWIEPDQKLWLEGRTLVWCAIDHRSSMIDDRSVVRYDRTRRSRMTATMRNTMFIDQAANQGATNSLPPTAFMIWMPVR
jgi:hypothetical protein